MLHRLLIIHGPNLNILGTREPQIYGTINLAEVDTRLNNLASNLGAFLSIFQSNYEGALIERIQKATEEKIEFIIINPAAYTHTSIAIIDALDAVAIPFIEVHLSNVYARQQFRQNSYFSARAQAVVMGFGVRGYEFALEYAIERLSAI